MTSSKPKKEIQDDLIQTAESVFINESDISIESSYEDTVGWDSLGTLNLIMAVEDEFDIQFSEEELETIQSLNDIYSIILDKERLREDHR